MGRVRRGYVLAGGRSSRMGRDKALIPVDGVPLAARIADVLAAAGLDVYLIRRGHPADPPWHLPDGAALPVVHEPDDGEPHPLHGVVTALTHAGEDVLVCPCDLPALTAEDVGVLLAAPVPANAWTQRALREAGQYLPVVPYSQGASIAHVMDALSAGAAGYLEWPSAHDALQRSLVPGRLQSLAELSYEFVAGMVRENVGPNGRPS